ncbi:hypothetical protein E3U43_001041 [Larimichthys crocea]|nr:hypothetical protein E3U43_001041 [Larimichthys crocea]
MKLLMTETVKYVDDEHKSIFLKLLNEQRLEGEHCDIAVVVEDVKFRAHRCVLAACSNYFKKLFKKHEVDNSSVIEIDFIRSDIFEEVLNYMYTAKISVKKRDKRDVSSEDKDKFPYDIVKMALPPEAQLAADAEVTCYDQDVVTEMEAEPKELGAEHHSTQTLTFADSMGEVKDEQPPGWTTATTDMKFEYLLYGHREQLACQVCGKTFLDESRLRKHEKLHSAERPFACEICTKAFTTHAHLKAVDCFYNQTVSELFLSLNTRGVRQGGGVCIDCQQNTAGINCETCRPGYYRPAEGFTGQQCDRCAFGYRDFPHCVRCDCYLSGSINTDPCSPCICKPTHGPSVVSGNDLPTPGNTSSGHTHQQVLTWAAPDSFLGNKGNGRALRLSPPLLLFLSPLAERSVAMAMAWQQFLDVQTGLHITRDDLLSVLADVISLKVRVHLNTSADGPIRLRSVSLDFADSSSVSGVQAVAVETCECPWGYSGTSCEACLPGFYRVGGVLFGGNCMQCECNDHAMECDINGVCLGCTHNTTGPHCDQCLPGFYGDATEGTAEDCRTCPCPLTKPSNSFSPTCVLEASGQVSCDRCQEGYTGRNCERCASGFYGNPQIVGGACARCECNGNVDVREAGHCDTVTGECLRCLGNTAGRHCEVCQPGHYGDAVHTKDCQECGCDVSGSLSSVCDVTTGECLCRQNVMGRTCDRCQSGFFGLQNGCQACGCSQLGSLSESCDAKGRCQCAEGVAGHKCDHCSHGYYGFHANGCTACTCDHTKGNCDPESGECICPAHTEGDTCHRCETGYWGHDPTTGCKISLARTPALLSLVSQSNLQGEVSGVYQQGGDMLLDTRQFNSSRLTGPLYWRLPPHFEGPQLLSYGGLLTYIVTFYAEDGSGLSNQEPQVLMRGGTLRKLVIYTDMVAPSNGIRTQHDIRMTEHTWKYFNSVLEKSVSRADFMSVLSNIEYVIIKASYGTRLQQSRISNITMETVLEVEPESHDRAEVGEGVARLIESSATVRAATQRLEPARTVSITPVGGAVSFVPRGIMGMPVAPLATARCVPAPCGATGELRSDDTLLVVFSQLVDVNGVCVVSAPRVCPRERMVISAAPPVRRGTRGDTVRGEGHDITGCSVGYYGNPSTPGGVCSRCSCSGWGSLQPLCDPLSGQCDCKAGVKGRSCDHCDERHILQGEQCVSCDDECSGILLDDLEKIHAHFLSVNLSAVAVAPYRQLMLLENQTSGIQVGVAALHLSRVEDELNHVTSDLSALMQQVARLSNNLDKVGVSTSQGALLLENLSSLQDNIQVLRREAERLNQTKEDELSSANQTRLVHEVASMLETIRAINLTATSVAASQELSLAESLVDFLQNHFLSSRAAADNKLRPLSASLSVHMETLQCAYTHLNDAARQNTQTHTLLDTIHTLLHRYQMVRHNLSTECLFEGGVMEDSQVLLDDAVSLTEDLTNTTTPIKELQNLSSGWSTSLQQTQSQAAVTHSGLREALQRLHSLRQQLQDSSSVVENTNSTARETNQLVTVTRSAANEAQRKLEEIKVAVQADRDCVRSYRPQIQSSNFNTLSLTLKTSSPENLLFYLGSNTTVDFLAVQMHDGKVSLVWNVGSGSTKLEFPGLDINNNRWTKINVTRFGAHGSLSVHQLELESAPLPAVTATSPGPSRVLDIDRNSVIHIGGLGAHTQSPTVLRSATFQGCLGEASLNERSIGLWNYISREGECGGCFSR